MNRMELPEGQSHVLGGTGPVAQQLRSELLRAIVSLEMKPGTRISEAELAERYGVSRQPVREAVIWLGQTGLVKTLPQRGTVVVQISVRDMLDARFVREAIEVAVARRASISISPEVRHRLDAIVGQQEVAVANNDRQTFFRFDEAFHSALCQGAGSDTAWDSIKNVKVHMDRVCSLTLKSSASMAHLVTEHRAILAAVDAQDPDAAAQAMSAHLHGILSSLPQIEAEFPEYFD
ncbi:MAG TPA: GntR family transcriptional regulator [Devosiaceae bacterium]|jgi:DNA-binding GntR family transcriptional regulator